ncbi:hypothetical protein UFOVP1305_14 [uncultured Caudovirales phage]|uniref:Uncharacterized protein n=1 Tax=uncultured Caudovirales phage TaxID=2100421 RepID=A0A6J5RUZ4_9CAUD|nr:hypothetical protein UFOVP896_52 [uncultured Caudovirales phage]CAB4197438.1 hypothetical protein UFOVP1305_14 [uncultured Caudovirales phage]
MNSRTPVTQADVESMLVSLSDALAEATDEFRDLCEVHARAEMDYKHAYHSAVVALATQARVTADVRKSTAWLRSENQERAYSILSAAKEAAREHMRSLVTRIEATRTLSANVRAQT